MPAVFPILKIFQHSNVFLVSSAFLNLGTSLAQGTIKTGMETHSKVNVLRLKRMAWGYDLNGLNDLNDLNYFRLGVPGGNSIQNRKSKIQNR